MLPRLKMDDGADGFAFLHQVERLVDAFQRHGVGDERVELDVAAHRIFHHARQFRAAAHAAKGTAAPHPAGDELEGTGGDFLPGLGHADDDAFAPALVAAFQRRAHHLHVADAFETIFHPAVGELDDDFLDGLVIILRVKAVRPAHLPRQGEFRRVDIHRNDASGLRLAGALNHRQADAAQAEYGDVIPRLHLGGILHRADARGDPAAQQAHFFQRCLRVDFGQRDFGHHVYSLKVLVPM